MRDNTLYLVVPAFSDQAGFMRIVREKPVRFRSANPLQAYYAHPEDWEEVGQINTRAQQQQVLACFDGPEQVRQDIEDSLPVMGGTLFLHAE